MKLFPFSSIVKLSPLAVFIPFLATPSAPVTISQGVAAAADKDWNFTTIPANMFAIPLGNVGIGTDSSTTPRAKLQVVGSILVGNSITGSTYAAPEPRVQADQAGGARILGIQGSTPDKPAIGFFSTDGVNDGGGGNGIFRPLANTMAFATASAERMRITSGGAIGIGTQNPTSPLTIANGGAFDLHQLALQNSVGGDQAMRFLGATNWNFGQDASDAGKLKFSTNLLGDVGVDTKAVLDQSGNFGLGTSAPTARLHVAGTARLGGVTTIDAGQRVQSATAGGARILGDQGSTAALPAIGFFSTDGVNDGGGGNGIFRPLANTMAFATSSLERMRISSGGSVGIGRSPATNRLEVEGDASKTTAGSWLANSDRRIKKEIHGLVGALDTIRSVRPVAFRYTDEFLSKHPGTADIEYYNVIAQEFAEVFPDYVKDSGENGLLQVDTYPALIHAIGAIQELHAELESTNHRATVLEERLARLEAELKSRSVVK